MFNLSKTISLWKRKQLLLNIIYKFSLSLKGLIKAQIFLIIVHIYKKWENRDITLTSSVVQTSIQCLLQISSMINSGAVFLKLLIFSIWKKRYKEKKNLIKKEVIICLNLAWHEPPSQFNHYLNNVENR